MATAMGVSPLGICLQEKRTGFECQTPTPGKMFWIVLGKTFRMSAVSYLKTMIFFWYWKLEKEN